MTPRQRAAAAGELTYMGGAMCKYGHLGARYTSTGDCLECCRRPGKAGRFADPAPAPDPRIRELSGKLHEVQAEARQAAARVKLAVRKFDAAPDEMKKWRASEAVAREHRTQEDLQRQAAALELDLEASRPAPDPMRLAVLLEAAGAPPTPPPVRFELRTATAAEIQAGRERVCKDPDLLIYAAQVARNKLVRDTTRARMMVDHPEGGWTAEEWEAARLQTHRDLGFLPLPVVEPDPHTEEQAALVDRLTSVGPVA